MKLYAFTTPDIPKNAGYLKIGETNGSVEKRVEQEGHELNVEHKIVWQDAVLTDRSHIDKRIHRYLTEQGFPIQHFTKSGKDTELVKCTVDDLEKAFAVVKQQIYNEEKQREKVGKQFYLEIRNWYYWTAKTGDDPYSVAEPEYTLRLIVRLMLCFFLREKEITPSETLVPKELFDEHWLNENLKENEGYRYYNAIIRNLFFHCLNTPVKDRNDFEYLNLIKNKSKVKEQFQKIPFLNGGLFNELPGDNFALDNYHFFAENHREHIQELDGDYEVEGIVRILSKYRYKLSLDDLLDQAEYTNTIDPEFMGKVFESLLACIDADSKDSRRKVTGSFYTPREIVDYMVNESLDEYLKTNDDLLQCKILDPACGSGAFPCGVMNEMMWRIDPDKKLSQTERYHKKLEILQKVIYGVDIQPMAVQIAVLRLFLSLIQDIKPDKSRDNYGIEPLPNLETKFVCANTLIGLRNGGQQYLQSPQVKLMLQLLANTRHQHFMASTTEEKERLQKFDEATRQTLIKLLETDGALSDRNAPLLANWNPYDQNSVAGFFDTQWMFGIDKFDIIIGNPPYGASYPAEHKEYFKKHYESAKTISGKQKGSLDTFSLFIEKGFNLIPQGGYLHYIVPISIVSSDSMTALHKLLLQNCETIKVSSFCDRPLQIFKNSHKKTSIISLTKTESLCTNLLMTQMYRWHSGVTQEQLLNKLKFIDARKYCLEGRFPKISNRIEKTILKKLFAKNHTRIGALLQGEGNAIYYRVTGGMYYNVITNYSTESTQEKPLYFDKNLADVVGAILSSSLFWWYQQVYSNNLDLKSSEINSFPIPDAQLTPDIIRKIERLYARYLKDIERNVVEHTTTEYKNVTKYKEYKIRYSKHLIDAIDDLICPLYGLTDEETEFIKNYESAFRLDD
ncbi:hypothetical protein FACS189454_04410 [Planctomycetales bacterium]|nr:hypothetical protein FACS189454_04410 [Planctomycetales bacterium]